MRTKPILSCLFCVLLFACTKDTNNDKDIIIPEETNPLLGEWYLEGYYGCNSEENKARLNFINDSTVIVYRDNDVNGYCVLHSEGTHKYSIFESTSGAQFFMLNGEEYSHIEIDENNKLIFNGEIRIDGAIAICDNGCIDIYIKD